MRNTEGQASFGELVPFLFSEDGEMENVLPELKKGDQLVRVGKDRQVSVFTISKVGRGIDFDEPVYRLTGKYGVTLKNTYTGEELARMGYVVCPRKGDENVREEPATMKDIFGEVISSYGRAQAIEDGVLVDVSEMAKQAGIKHSVALTTAVYDEYVSVPKAMEGLQDESGRLWDVLWMYSWAVRSGMIKGSQGLFEVSFLMWDSKEVDEERLAAGQKTVTLKAVCGPNDDGSPCITIMLPDED